MLCVFEKLFQQLITFTGLLLVQPRSTGQLFLFYFMFICECVCTCFQVKWWLRKQPISPRVRTLPEYGSLYPGIISIPRAWSWDVFSDLRESTKGKINKVWLSLEWFCHISKYPNTINVMPQNIPLMTYFPSTASTSVASIPSTAIVFNILSLRSNLRFRLIRKIWGEKRERESLRHEAGQNKKMSLQRSLNQLKVLCRITVMSVQSSKTFQRFCSLTSSKPILSWGLGGVKRNSEGFTLWSTVRKGIWLND